MGIVKKKDLRKYQIKILEIRRHFLFIIGSFTEVDIYIGKF